jgi:hypothetical protein
MYAVVTQFTAVKLNDELPTYAVKYGRITELKSIKYA